MVNVNENLNVYGAITQKIGEEDKAIVAVNSNFSNNNNSFTFSFNILDTRAVTADKENMQKQMDEFIASMKKKMQELGYAVTI